MPTKSQLLARLKPIQIWLGIILLAGAPFTFNPSYALPTEGLISFRVGLYQLLMVAFVAVMSPLVWKLRRQLLNDKWLVVPLAILTLLTIVSPLRSLNMNRSLLFSASIILLLLTMVCGWVYMKELFTTSVQRKATKFILLTSIGVGLFTVFQFVINTYSDRAVGLCEKCTASVFGFPRINGFSAEPQFLASALLLPILLSYFLLSQSKRIWQGSAVFGLLIFVLGISLSRGGIVAATIGIATLSLFLAIKRRFAWKRIALAIGISVLAGTLSIAALVGSARVRHHQNPDIAKMTFATVVEHMTGGALQLSYNDPKPQPSPYIENEPQTIPLGDEVFQTPGEISASQDDREQAVSLGLRFWRDSLTHIIVGLGAGNLGSYANDYNPQYPLSFTIYMQYVFMLTEFGLLGLVSFLLLCWLGVKRAFQLALETPFVAVLGSLLVAYLGHYYFFGTYINVPYVWLIFGIALGAQQMQKSQ